MQKTLSGYKKGAKKRFESYFLISSNYQSSFHNLVVNPVDSTTVIKKNNQPTLRLKAWLLQKTIYIFVLSNKIVVNNK